MNRHRQLELELRVAATLDCAYDVDGPYVPAALGRSPDRCSPAEGGAVAELDITVRDLCVEDERRDLLTGADYLIRERFLVALRDLVVAYDDRTRAYTEQLEQKGTDCE